MYLIVVESPTKAKTLGRFLDKQYKVEATMGHIKDLPKSKLGVDVEKNFSPDYLPVEGKEDSVAAIIKGSKGVDKVYIATDPDREGEAIAKHVEEILEENKIKNSKLERIVFHEITKGAVETAIEKPRGIDKKLVDAQIARRVLDRLVGYKLSPLLWKKVRRGLSAGRVQSVAVRLIVEKEEEIKAFKPDEYWEIFVDLLTKGKKDFSVKLAKIGEKTAEVGKEVDAKKVVADLEKGSYKVNAVKRREVVKKPYAPFTTSTMTQGASRLFGWSAKKTMSVAQKLYEEGLITYHRTDSVNVASSALTGLRNYIKKTYGEKYLPENPHVYKTKSKRAQEAHEAIRPTKVASEFKVRGKRFALEAEKLYKLIWNRFVSSQMSTSVFDSTTIDVKTGDYLLRATGQIMKFDGWRKVLVLKSTNGEQVLPDVKEGDALDLKKVNPEQKFTQPPPRFNEASLIKTLEQLGIGRPSTYAPIISTIQARNYVEKKDGKFYSTHVGEAVTTFLKSNFDEIMEYQFTADMEDNLDAVEDGKHKWQEMMGKFYKPFEKKLKSVEKNAKRVKIETEKLGKTCPKCGKKDKGELVIRIGRFGKFISCSRFPDCDFTDKYEERIGMKCPDCKKGHIIVKKTRKGRQFYGCSEYPNCEYASWKDPRVKKTEEGESAEKKASA